MSFSFQTAGKIVFGNGKISEIDSIVSSFGASKVLVVTGRNASRAAPLTDVLTEKGVQYSVFSVMREPTTALADEGARMAREGGVDLVIGFGGGSVVDAGKAIAILATNAGVALDYLEVIGSGKTLTAPSLPFIAVPTTAGTGAEVTKNAVLLSEQHQVKVSLRSELMFPAVALVDPQLTVSTPAAVTRACGLDAFTQCLEPYVSCLANPVTDGFCLTGMARAKTGLKAAVQRPDDLQAREDMAVCSLLGGLALANAKLGAVHGFAGVLGGMYPAGAHGAICAATLPHCMRATIRALRERGGASGVRYLQRFEQVARLLTDDEAATAEAGADWVQALCDELQVPGLAEYGVPRDDSAVLADIAERSGHSSSMKGNALPLTQEELVAVLIASL